MLAVCPISEDALTSPSALGVKKPSPERDQPVDDSSEPQPRAHGHLRRHSIKLTQLMHISSYFPYCIVQFLSQRGGDPPQRHTLTTAVLFADISGYFAICNQLGDDHRGIEDLAHIVKSYFGILVKIVRRHGGDVLRFDGDALIVIWPSTGDTLSCLARQCCQCALEIQRILHGLSFRDSRRLCAQFALNVKIGIGVGDISIYHIGGYDDHAEFVAFGAPLTQAFVCEEIAAPGKCIISIEAAGLVSEYFETGAPHCPVFNEQAVGVDLIACHAPLAKRGIVSTTNPAEDLLDSLESLARLSDVLRGYLPAALHPYLSPGAIDDQWVSEIRKVSILFLHIAADYSGIDDVDLPRFQQVMLTLQQSIYSNGGAINKILLDDKGITVLAVFGLMPIAHANDSMRAVVAAIASIRDMNTIGVDAFVGCTTGHAFCGITGGNTRREFSLLGNVVNIAARLMQHAMANRLPIVVDNATRYAAQSLLEFEELGPTRIKGRESLMRAFIVPSQHVYLRPSILTGNIAASAASAEAIIAIPASASTPAQEATYPAFSAITDIILVLDDNSKMVFDCSGVYLVGEARYGVMAALGIQPHQHFTFRSSDNLIEIDDALRLDVVPVAICNTILDGDRLVCLRFSELPLADSDSDMINGGRHLQRLIIANCVNDMLNFGRCQCIVVQGALGTGKTHLISTSLRAAPTLIIHEQAVDLSSCNGSLVWSAILSRLRPHCLDRDLAVRLDQLGADRHAPVLTDTALALIAHVSQRQPVIIIIDSAQLLDQSSIDLATKVISARMQGLLLCLSIQSSPIITKPLFFGTRLHCTPSFLKSFKELFACPSTIGVQLGPLPDVYISHVINDTILTLGSVSPSTLAVLVARSTGNPMLCREIIYALLRSGELSLHCRRHLSLAKAPSVPEYVLALDTMRPFPVPFSLQNTLGELIDGLPNNQQMLLKVASVLGTDVHLTLDLIKSGFPFVSELPYLFRDLQALFCANILTTIDADKRRSQRLSLPNFHAHYDVKRDRIDSPVAFVFEFVRSRLLNRQVKQIAQKAIRQLYRSRVSFCGPLSVNHEMRWVSHVRARRTCFTPRQHWSVMWVEGSATTISFFTQASAAFCSFSILRQRRARVEVSRPQALPSLTIDLRHADLTTAPRNDQGTQVVVVNAHRWVDEHGRQYNGTMEVILASKLVEIMLEPWFMHVMLLGRLKTILQETEARSPVTDGASVAGGEMGSDEDQDIIEMMNTRATTPEIGAGSFTRNSTPPKQSQ